MMKVMPMTADHGTPLVRLAPPNAIMGDTEFNRNDINISPPLSSFFFSLPTSYLLPPPPPPPPTTHINSGIIGSGLCVFSRHPIISVNAQKFTAGGALREIKDGEMFAGKGILTCRIMTPSGPLLFATTHVSLNLRDRGSMATRGMHARLSKRDRSGFGLT